MESKSLEIANTMIGSYRSIAEQLGKIPSNKKRPFTKTYNRRPRKKQETTLALTKTTTIIQQTVLGILKIQSQPTPKRPHGTDTF